MQSKMDRSYSGNVIRFAKLGPTFVKSICNIFLIRDVLLFQKYAGYVGVLNCSLIALFNTFHVPFILFLCLAVV